ncbi:MAG: MBL fold metallo-hydrolase [Oscillospiraceae bacterium]|nr:MBL fold metallo-hydrolase [Oscillospiraceae bacterium]
MKTDYQKVYEHNFVEIFKLTDQIYFRYASWDERNQCNGGFIVFDDFLAVIDAPGIEGAKEMLAEAAQLFGPKPIKYVILTHGHWDHADGLPVFTELGAAVIGSANMLKKLETGGVQLPELSVGIERSARIVIGGMAFEPFTLPGSVHSEEDLFIVVPSENMVFTGDAVAELPNLFFGNGDFDNWLAALDVIEAKNFATICVGHGRVKDGSHFAVQRAYFNALNGAVDDDNDSAKKAAEMAGENVAARHIAALRERRQAQ